MHWYIHSVEYTAFMFAVCTCSPFPLSLEECHPPPPTPPSQYPRAHRTPISPGFSLCVSVVACLISYCYVPFSHSVSCSFIILIPTVYCAKRSVWCLYSNVVVVVVVVVVGGGGGNVAVKLLVSRTQTHANTPTH